MPNDCKQCGSCCRFMLLELKDEATEDYKKWFFYHINPHDKRLFEFLRIENRDFIKIGLYCNYLKIITEVGPPRKDYTECEIYEDRPQMCKDFHCEDPKYSHVKHLLKWKELQQIA